jgi:plastocyanin
VDPETGQPGAPRRAGGSWRWVIAAAAVVTVACSAVAVAAAVTTEESGPAAAGSGGTRGSGPSEQVTIRDFAFDPPDLTISVGTAVTWTNEDNTTHTVTGRDNDVIASPDLDQGDTYSVTFSQAGTFHYLCSIHTNMTGTVTVNG